MRSELLGQRVREERIKAGMTQVKLAKRAGMSLSYLGHIERGTRQISMDLFISLVNALDVSPEILLQDMLNPDLLSKPSETINMQTLREIGQLVEKVSQSWDQNA